MSDTLQPPLIGALQTLLAAANQGAVGPTAAGLAPETLEGLSVTERDLLESLQTLVNDHHQLRLRHRRSNALMLADVDALSEALGHVGLGDYAYPVPQVQLPALDLVRIGIEDMTTNLRRAQEKLGEMILELRQSEEKFRSLVESSSDWIWEVDRDGTYRYSSPQVESILGYTPEEVVGRTPFEMMPREEAVKMLEAFNELVKSAAPIIGLENTNLHKDGHEVVLEKKGTPFLDEYGEVLGYRGIDRDISVRKRMEDQLRFIANHDTLTGLYNRQQLQQHLLDELNRSSRYDHSLSLFLLDIDHFKQINDQHGHSAGDEVLRHFAQVLTQSLRRTDFIARYGGEEFVTILTETGLADAQKFADRLCRNIAASPFQINPEQQIKVTASIGVASYPEHGESAQALIEAADAAMYSAKKSGRNQVKLSG